MEFKTCYKCGKSKLAIINKNKGDTLPSKYIQMTMMAYGKHRNQFKCKDCSEKPRIFEELRDINEGLGFEVATEIETTLKFHPVVKKLIGRQVKNDG